MDYFELSAALDRVDPKTCKQKRAGIAIGLEQSEKRRTGNTDALGKCSDADEDPCPGLCRIKY